MPTPFAYSRRVRCPLQPVDRRHVARRARYARAVELVRDGGTTCRVRADVIALDRVPCRTGTHDGDSVDTVAGDHVTLGSREAADAVRTRSSDQDAVLFGAASVTGGVRTHVATFDYVTALTADGNAAAGETIDYQAADRRVAAGHREALRFRPLPFSSTIGVPAYPG